MLLRIFKNHPIWSHWKCQSELERDREWVNKVAPNLFFCCSKQKNDDSRRTLFEEICYNEGVDKNAVPKDHDGDNLKAIFPRIEILRLNLTHHK